MRVRSSCTHKFGINLDCMPGVMNVTARQGKTLEENGSWQEGSDQVGNIPDAFYSDAFLCGEDPQIMWGRPTDHNACLVSRTSAPGREDPLVCPGNGVLIKPDALF